ncbi:hypothetical protein HU200_004707 [Digitaria exilis]|uniref:non-specific serine/threonine protein kinase n=1 Tax=Digitaria exilis TaxID=1010633 RepID=A0A835FSY8_9POAL|nr:hypothetical protein HU200_004707 [Digitaria exilis]
MAGACYTILAMAANHHLLCLLLLLLLSLASHARDTITRRKPLIGNETLVSAGTGSFVFGFFTPTGSPHETYLGVWYARVTPRTVVWVLADASLDGSVEQNAQAELCVDCYDYDLLMTPPNTEMLWHLQAPGVAQRATLLDNGNLVLYDEDDKVVWQGFDHPSGSLLPGMRVGLAASGNNLSLPAWTSPSNSTPSTISLVMNTSGVPELFIWNGSTKVWRSGPWDGDQFAAILDNATSFSYVHGEREISYVFQVRNSSALSRLVLNSSDDGSGLLQRWTWSEADGKWGLDWFVPNKDDQCDTVSRCGPNSVCNSSSSQLPLCSCLPGFTPQSPAAWEQRDWRDGCGRKTPLDCVNGTDGFAVVRRAKAPDTGSAAVDYAASFEQCRQRCLRNCSCTAYASVNASGCITWTGGLTDLSVYPDSRQDLYVRVAAAWRLWNEGNGLDIVDNNLNGSFNTDEVLKCIKVGLLCVQESPEDRPHMSQVLQMLASPETSALHNLKQPGFAPRRDAEDMLPSKPDCSVADSMTTTLIEGR